MTEADEERTEHETRTVEYAIKLPNGALWTNLRSKGEDWPWTDDGDKAELRLESAVNMLEGNGVVDQPVSIITRTQVTHISAESNYKTVIAGNSTPWVTDVMP